ncbi:MAG: PD-(D/E)XK nuclease family protein [Candidatus Nanoarchaeia archaeon]|nr:PD-(D/E)XK nuclease family protein [Candidatus Nanoarchaeia archaeon]MDD5741517.1 PD-(D/E)XK nuclease family protein [Candidatus Nanoarchaeia archaeon]
MLFKLSPSTLNLMHECPRCFWLSVHKIWSRPAGIFPSLPSGMDGILKTHFDNFMEKGKLPPELCDNSECKNLKLFDDKELLKEWRNSRKGLWFEDKDGNILHGGIDNMLINKINNKFIVLDYKTRGFPLKEDTHEHYQNQLNIYAWLLEKLGYKVEDFAYLLFYYPKEVLETGEVVFNTDLKKMKISPEDAEKLFNKAIKMLNEDCPKETCVWCEKG